MKNTEIYTEIGQNIRQLRKRHCLKQSDLARRLNMKQQQISAIENGQRYLPIHKLEAIARALNVSPWQLWRAHSIARKRGAR